MTSGPARTAVIATLLVGVAFDLGAQIVIRGTVHDSATGQPLGGAVVAIRAQGRQAATRTDEAGTYLIEDIEIGPYVLVIRRIGYAAHAAEVDVPASGLTYAAALRPIPQALAAVRVSGEGMGVYGRIAALSDSRPIAGARVQVAATNRSVQTDSGGTFFVPVKSPGPYVVRVTAKGFTAEFFTVVVHHDQVADASTLLEAGEDGDVFGGGWMDFDQRLRWRSPNNSAVASGADLRAAGGGLLEAVEGSAAVAANGLRFGRGVCIYLNGVATPGLPISSLRPKDITAVEVYGRDRTVTGSLRASWPRNRSCSATGRNGGGPVISFLMVWVR